MGDITSASWPNPPAALAPLPMLSQRLVRREHIDRHRHAGAYAALVLAGSYLEAGDTGRRTLGAGDVAVHAGFAAHHNRVGSEGALVLNLRLSGCMCAEGFGRVQNPDAVVRAAESDPVEAVALLWRMFEPMPPQCHDWPDALCADLARDPALSLSQWALSNGLAVETLSRGFRSAYGVTPKRMRFEHRARRALLRVVGSSAPLVQVALDAGFADQSHMSHAIVALSGRSAGHWRARSSRDKTQAARPGTLGG